MTEKSADDKTLDDDEVEEVTDPENLYIISEPDSLILDSIEEINDLMERLDQAIYDEKLAKFYSTYSHKIKDLTKK